MDKAQFYPPGGQQQQFTNPSNSNCDVFAPRGPYLRPPPVPPPLWSGQNVYQPPPPFQQSLWGSFQQTPGNGDQEYGYRSQYLQQPGFDPSRPPPGYCGPESSQISAFIEAQRAATHGSSQPEFEDQNDRYANQWLHGANGGSQANVGVSDFTTAFDQNRTLPDTGPQFYQSGFESSSNTGGFRQNRTDENYSENYERSLRRVTDEYFGGPWPKDHPRNQEGCKTRGMVPTDADSKQRKHDELWLHSFLLNRQNAPVSSTRRSEPDSKTSVIQIREKLYSAVQMVSELSIVCQTLKHNLENERAWTESYAKAVKLKSNLQERLNMFSNAAYINNIKNKVLSIRKRRVRGRRKKVERIEEKQKEDTRSAEREAAIDKWRMKRIQEVEEKKREQELKLAADAVLSEVRKKQADAKRMLDILRSLEKLRKLRKEAASRKGIFPEKECDDVFEGHVERLRGLIRKRTAVYGAEEKALRVMLEGEQEEERKREQEKRQKKERERLLHRKRALEAILFGAEMPPGHPLQPFQDYYTQAERSLPALIQIRREWDHFLVPVDHPDGSSVPQGWVVPEAPADEVWATALDKQATHPD